MNRHRNPISWKLPLAGLLTVLGTAFFPVRDGGEVRALILVARDRVLGRADAVYSGSPETPAVDLQTTR